MKTDLNNNDKKNKIQKQKVEKHFHYIVKEFFQEKGKNKKTILEEYIIREASNLL